MPDSELGKLRGEFRKSGTVQLFQIHSIARCGMNELILCGRANSSAKRTFRSRRCRHPRLPRKITTRRSIRVMTERRNLEIKTDMIQQKSISAIPIESDHHEWRTHPLMKLRAYHVGNMRRVERKAWHKGAPGRSTGALRSSDPDINTRKDHRSIGAFIRTFGAPECVEISS
jgi:hypothetical protein